MIGAKICGEIIFEVNLSLRNEYTWKEHGFQLTLPEGALPPGVTATVAVRAIIGGSFELPESSELIGAFYWITSTHTFQKEVTVRLQHCAIIENDMECEYFKFLIAKCPQPQLPYKFTVLDGNFSPHSQFASVSLSEFSIITVIYNWTPLPRDELSPLGQLSTPGQLSPPGQLPPPTELPPPAQLSPPSDTLLPPSDALHPPPDPLPPSEPKRKYTAQVWYKRKSLTHYRIAVIITQHLPTHLEVS